MTTIAGLITDDKVYMAADGRTTTGWEYEDGARKIVRRGDMLIGHAGDVRAAQIMQYVLDIPKHPDGVGDEEYFVAHFVPALRQTLKDEAYSEIESNKESQDSVFLIAYRGALYNIETNYTAFKTRHSFYAVGSGRQYAMGVLTAMDNLAPRDRVTKAVETAIKLDAASGGEVTVEILS